MISAAGIWQNLNFFCLLSLLGGTKPIGTNLKQLIQDRRKTEQNQVEPKQHSLKGLTLTFSSFENEIDTVAAAAIDTYLSVLNVQH